MNRRRFLAYSSAATGAALLAPLAVRAATCTSPPPGVQLFTVRDALARDPRAAFAALRKIGIVEGELFGLSGGADAKLFGLAPRELKAALDDAGLRVPFSHIGGELTDIAATATVAKTLGVSTVVVARPAEFNLQRGGSANEPVVNRAMLDALAAKLDRVGRDYREHGLVFGYHNHDVEFVRADGVIPYDYLMERTDPSLVKIELDLGWLAFSGIDPTAYLERHAGRVIACHLKDFDPRIATDVPQRKLVPPGAGTIDFARVLATLRKTGVAHGFIEVDVSDDPLAAVQSGHEHLERVGCG